MTFVESMKNPSGGDGHQPGFRNILGINFLDQDVARCIETIRRGGLLVVPSGPGLAGMDRDPDYAQAVRGADFAIADSGYMVLLVRWLKGVHLKRVSGLALIRGLLRDPGFRTERKLWVMPREKEWEGTETLLAWNGIPSSREDSFVAPLYPAAGPVEDPELHARIEASRPSWVILGIAGGKQEKLGWYLSRNLSYRPAIICIGAAIAFETGMQVNIPGWADRLYLGWLLRTINNPRVYGARYAAAFRLLSLVRRDKSVTL